MPEEVTEEPDVIDPAGLLLCGADESGEGSGVLVQVGEDQVTVVQCARLSSAAAVLRCRM